MKTQQLKCKLSRQRKWQLKRQSEGKCCQCGKPLATKWHCEDCRKKINRANRDFYYRNLKTNVDKAQKSTKSNPLKSRRGVAQSKGVKDSAK